MLIQETFTDLPGPEVIQRARTFFTLQFSPYAAFVEDESDTHIRFHTEAGGLTLAVGRQGDRNLVRGSTSRLNHELSQFLVTLSKPEEVRQSLPGPGASGGG
ncbi:hypothetical protein BH24GEM2_BH24GEM2_09000 [soil metagenome]